MVQKSIIVGVLLTLLSVSIFSSLNIMPTKAIGTIYIKADGSIDDRDRSIAIGSLMLAPSTQEAISQNSESSIEWWSKTYERPYMDRAWSVIQTVDGGYAILGETERVPGGVGVYPEIDYWLIKLDADWNVQWNRTYGAIGWCNRGHRIVQTRDEGYAMVGYTSEVPSTPEVQVSDYWLVKIDVDGNMQWNETYGTPYLDRPFSLVQTNDGGYAIVGKGNTRVGHGEEIDMLLVKTDADGSLQWSKIYGVPDVPDSGLSMVQTKDGGYAIAGAMDIAGTEDADSWLVKTDANGEMQWNRTYGGPEPETSWSVVQTSDGGYAMGGFTSSFGAGAEDFWLVKTDANGQMQWNKTYGGADNDRAYSMVQTRDGGYALVGATSSFGAGDRDFWFVKTDADGNEQWSEAFGGTYYECAYSVIQTREGTYAIVGDATSFGSIEHDYDFWLVVVPNPPQWPVADFTYSRSNQRGNLSVMFNASTSYDLNGTIISYTWDFGDGNIAAANAPTMIHTYAEEGIYKATLNVTNDFGLWSTGSMQVSASPIPDLNGDLCVNILDITIVATAYGSTPGDLGWNEVADLDKNGIVNILDISMVAKDFGKTM